MNDFPYAAVLFDMDGVIVDNMPIHRQVWLDFARARGHHPTEAQIRGYDGRRAADIVTALLGVTDPDAVKRLADAREATYHALLPTAELVPVPGVIAFLDDLAHRGIPRVLATSATPENVEVVLDRLALHGRFDAIVSAPDVTKGKPDPEVYLTAAGKVGKAAADCLVVEDALPGIRAGAAAGATVLGIATSEAPEALRAAGARFTAPDFRWTAFPWEQSR